jgi:repressor LexA
MGTTNSDLTKRERMVWTCVADHLTAKGYAPTLREICQETGIPSISLAARYLDELQAHGLVRRDPGISRGIVLIVHPGDNDGRDG